MKKLCAYRLVKNWRRRLRCAYRLVKKWRRLLPLDSTRPELGSWISVSKVPFKVGCTACAAAGCNTVFGLSLVQKVLEKKTGRLLRLAFVRHAKSPTHAKAVCKMLGKPEPDPYQGAPSADDFNKVLAAVREARSGAAHGVQGHRTHNR